MARWADEYVGLPFLAGGRDRAGLDCWGLLRLVWAERLGLIMPRFDGTDDPAETILLESAAMAEVERGCERELDGVVMATERLAGLGFRLAPTHVGVVTARGQVLHIEEGRLSMIEPMGMLQVVRIVRPC